jgi:DNA primase
VPRTCTVVAAVDADVAGHALASRLEALVRGHGQLTFRRDAPAGGKDWNEILQRIERDFIRLLPSRTRGRAGLER